MKNSAWIASLALLLSAVALGWNWLDSGRDAAAQSSSDLAPLPEDGSTQEELLALREEVRRLRDRLALLESDVPEAPARTDLGADAITREDLEALREEILALLGDAKPGVAAMSPTSQEFKEQLQSTLGEIRREQTAEKIRAGQEKRLAQLDERMAKMESQLGLSRDQSNRMRTALLARYEREDDLLIRWQSGEDPEILGEVKAEDAALHQAEVELILTPTQLETYRQSAGRGK